MPDLKAIIGKVASGQRLTRDEAEEAFGVIMSGEATPVQIGSFLTGLRMRGETVDEIAGAVATMRAKMLRVEAPEGAIDVVGTGGDATGSYNISTTSAFVVAGAGVPVAKHGNRALSSNSGAADTLTALGVRIDLAPEDIARCIREAGIGFMFAPAHHSAMKHVGPARAELGFRTVFNLIGPLSNPASVRRYLLGVFSPDWVEPLANVLATLGAERAWVVHGAGGFDEISPAGETKVASLENGKVTVFTVTPADAGLPVLARRLRSRAATPPTMPRRSAPCLPARRAPTATPSSSMPAPRWWWPALPPTSPKAPASPPRPSTPAGPTTARPARGGVQRLIHPAGRLGSLRLLGFPETYHSVWQARDASDPSVRCTRIQRGKSCDSC